MKDNVTKPVVKTVNHFSPSKFYAEKMQIQWTTNKLKTALQDGDIFFPELNSES